MLRAFNPFAAIQILCLDCRKISEGELVDVFIILLLLLVGSFYIFYIKIILYYTPWIFRKLCLAKLKNKTLDRVANKFPFYKNIMLPNTLQPIVKKFY